MSTELRPAVVTPPSTYLGRLLVVGAGGLVVGAVLGAAALIGTPAARAPAAIALTVIAVEQVAPPAQVAMETAPAPARPSGALALMFTAGGATYMQLASADAAADAEPAEAMPPHGRPVLHEPAEDDYVTSAVAPVQARDLPPAYRAWAGARVIVEGGCTATVTGFAVVARLTGSPGYTSAEDVEGDAWTVASVMEHGQPVLAARLDGCTGTYARDAALAPIVVPAPYADPALAAAATELLRATPAIAAAQAEWAEHGMPGSWLAAEGTETTTRVVRHPGTGVTWVAVHARHPGGCGDPDLGVWGLYRADAARTLTQVASSLGELTRVDQIVDVEGDGELELIGHTWRDADRVVIRVTGEPVTQLSVPFYGCGC